MIALAAMGGIYTGTAESAKPVGTQSTAKAPLDCTPPNGYTPLAQCLESNRDAIVGTPTCPNAILSGSALTDNKALGSILIKAGAQLVIPDLTTKLDTTGIEVSGTLQIGTADCPIDGANQVTIKFLGAKPEACLNNKDPHSKECHAKGINVNSGGTLLMYGEMGAGPSGVSWTRLSVPAGPADIYNENEGVLRPPESATKLTVADDISKDWQANDWIVVGTTDFASYNSEFVQIQTTPSKRTEGGSLITLKSDTKLVNYHFGGTGPSPGGASYADGADKNYGIEERAEVGLISRNIKLTAAIPTSAEDPEGMSLHWGGEIRILPEYNRVEIQGVEIENFGKDQLGSYPIHLHMVGTPTNLPIINSNSIHHSYNKCIVLHASSGITISNNVCARIVGHIFYLEDGTEVDNTFENNLGLGAMQNYFPLYITAKWDKPAKSCLPNDSSAPPLTNDLNEYFWNGDYLANPVLSIPKVSLNGFRVTIKRSSPPISYDGYNIPNYDTQTNYVHGTCYNRLGEARVTKPPTPCDPDEFLYFEPPSGFWLTNPTTHLAGNSIGGCQGAGRGIWYLPTDLNKNQPLGTFENNYVHACNNGLDTAADLGIISENLAPHNEINEDVIANFKGFTATRNRWRGVWVRPNWYNVDSARLATNLQSVSLVSSGGPDGNKPGVWSMLSNSVLAGMSTNNPDRLGPLFKRINKNTGEVETDSCASASGQGCLCEVANVFNGQAYPNPEHNFQGYMFYDGPARIVSNRFINFNKNLPECDDKIQQGCLSKLDKSYFDVFSSNNKLPFDDTQPFVYEGDAALGWIQSNEQSVPPTQYTEDLIFENTDLRHQVYTEFVKFGAFLDGDKNTVILDRDGTLTGYKVVGPNGEPRLHKFLVSLNNLPFLGSEDLSSPGQIDNPSSVDECHSTGAQDVLAENRGTSLISPFDYATLETSVLTCQGYFPNFSPTGPCLNEDVNNPDEIMFVKDQIDYGIHQSMALRGRNKNGIYEPKVVDGWGYTLQKSPKGFPNFFSLGYTDANTEDMSTNPFNVRVGICLKTTGGTIPGADNCTSDPSGCTPNFSVQRGYKSYGGGSDESAKLSKFWNDLPQCKNLDNQTFNDIGIKTNIPDPGNNIPGCPSPGYPSASFPIEQLAETDDISKVDATHYYYDADKGLLFFQVIQDVPNAIGPSPLGSCEADSPAPCPQNGESETFYPCPVEGCILYTVTVNSTDYDPVGPTNCAPYGGSGSDDGDGGYTQTYPQGVCDTDSGKCTVINVGASCTTDEQCGTDRLAYVVPGGEIPPDPITNSEIAQNEAKPYNEARGISFPHNLSAPGKEPYCPENSPM